MDKEFINKILSRARTVEIRSFFQVLIVRVLRVSEHLLCRAYDGKESKRSKKLKRNKKMGD